MIKKSKDKAERIKEGALIKNTTKDKKIVINSTNDTNKTKGDFFLKKLFL